MNLRGLLGDMLLNLQRSVIQRHCSGFAMLRRVIIGRIYYYHHHHHLFAQNTIKIDNGYVNERDRKAHLSTIFTSTVERNTHNTIHGIGVTRNR